MKFGRTSIRRIGRSPLPYIALAVIASLLMGVSIFTYTSGVERRVLGRLTPIKVLVAADPILPGTTLGKAIEQGMTKVTQYPAESIPEGALRPNEANLLNNEAGQAIKPGEILLASHFSGASKSQSLLQIPDGLLATTIEVAPAAKVGAFLRPYDYVVVYLTTKASGLGGKPTTTVLLRKALVLAVGTNASRTKTTASSDKVESVTLGLTTNDSLTLVAGLQSGEIYLGLLSPTTDPFEG